MTRLDPRAHAAALWSFRARAEHDAAVRFRGLAQRLEHVDAEPVVIRLAHEAASDETRHHAMCIELAQRFGASPGRDTAPHVEPPQRAGSERARILHEIVAMSCITETLSAALLVQMRDRARDTEVRRVVHEILRDEVQHARLGWAHLAAEARRTDVAALAPAIPAMLAATVHDEIFSADAPHVADAEVAGLGGLDRPTRRTIFIGTMRELVFPGLRTHGIPTDAAERWLSSRA